MICILTIKFKLQLKYILQKIIRIILLIDTSFSMKSLKRNERHAKNKIIM